MSPQFYSFVSYGLPILTALVLGLLRSTRPFIWAVGSHWVSLMTGGLVSLGVWFYSRQTQQDIPEKVFISVVVSCLLVATSQAWNDEQAAKLKEQDSKALLQAKVDELQTKVNNLSKPKLEGTINFVQTNYQTPLDSDGNAIPNAPQQRAALLTVSIRNLGAPTIVQDYHLEIKVHGMSIRKVRPTGLPKNMYFGQYGKTIPNINESSLSDRTATKQIPQGGQERGYLLFIVPELPTERSGVTFTLLYKDVTQHEYQTHFDWGNAQEEPNPVDVPGVERFRHGKITSKQ